MATDAQNIEELAVRSQEVIFETSTVFPFTFFPDRISIDRVKVSVTKRIFWLDKITESILHDEIVSISAHSVFFLGGVTITPRQVTLKPFIINSLKREDAQRIRRILQGLSAARQKEVDLDSLDRDTLLSTVEAIGRAN
ncbi:hypothetical protein BH11PAT4_BH11PAT4_6640 [soil metagenome]